MILKNYSDNKLLLISLLTFFPTAIIYFIINYFAPEKLDNLSRLNLTTNFEFTALSALFISPIIEEYIFRSTFLNKKIFTYFSYVGITLYIIITGNYYLFVILGIFLFADVKDKKWIMYFSNSILFALVHYQTSDFSSIFTLLPMLSQFSIGLLLIWITINFGIVKSILAHFFFNSFIIVPIFFLIQFPKKSINTVQHKDITLVYSKTSYFGKTNIEVSEDEINAHRLTVVEFYQIYGLKNKIKTPDTIQIFKYDFRIININKRQLDSTVVKSLLKDAHLAK